MDKQYFVYLLTNKPYVTIYTGITSSLIQRVYQHAEAPQPPDLRLETATRSPAKVATNVLELLRTRGIIA